MTVRQWLLQAEKHVDRADARILLCHVLEWDRGQVMARLDEQIPQEAMAILDDFLEDLCTGRPLPYVTKQQEFFGRKFFVNNHVLIPRPDTEALIDVALKLEFPEGYAKVLDIGTGSGCIAITLAAERPVWDVTGSDISEEAIAMAKANAHNLQIRAEFVLSDLFKVATGPWDLVVSNPPYIGRAEQLPASVVEYEPHLALFAEEDGLGIYRRLADQGRAHTNLMLVEIGYLQAQTVPQVFAEYGWHKVSGTPDLNGIERAQLFAQ